MAIPDNKKEYLKKAGLSDDAIARIEEANRQKAQTASELQLESKESAETAVTEEVEVAKDETVEVVEVVEEKSQEPEQAVEYVTKEAIVALTEKLVDTLQNGLSEIRTAIKEIETKVEAVEEKQANAIPSASMAALMAQGMSVTASGSPNEASIKKSSKLAGSKPVEKETSDAPKYSENPLADTIMRGLFG